MCVCAEGKQVTSLLHIRFPRTEPGEKLFDYAQWKHFACLDLGKEMGLSGSMAQDSGRKHWRWDEHSFLLSVLCSRRRCRRCPSWRMRVVLTTGGHHSIGGFIFFFLIVIAVNPLVTAALASFCCWDEPLTKSSSERKGLFGLHFRSQATPEGNQDRNSRQEPENHKRKLLAGLFSAGIRIQT